MKIFPEIAYFSLKTMAQRSLQESDDERNIADEEKPEEDEFSTYFSENRVEIPEIETVNISSEYDKSAMCRRIQIEISKFCI